MEKTIKNQQQRPGQEREKERHPGTEREKVRPGQEREKSRRDI